MCMCVCMKMLKNKKIFEASVSISELALWPCLDAISVLSQEVVHYPIALDMSLFCLRYLWSVSTAFISMVLEKEKNPRILGSMLPQA